MMQKQKSMIILLLFALFFSGCAKNTAQPEKISLGNIIGVTLTPGMRSDKEYETFLNGIPGYERTKVEILKKFGLTSTDGFIISARQVESGRMVSAETSEVVLFIYTNKYRKETDYAIFSVINEDKIIYSDMIEMDNGMNSSFELVDFDGDGLMEISYSGYYMDNQIIKALKLKGGDFTQYELPESTGFRLVIDDNNTFTVTNDYCDFSVTFRVDELIGWRDDAKIIVSAEAENLMESFYFEAYNGRIILDDADNDGVKEYIAMQSFTKRCDYDFGDGFTTIKFDNSLDRFVVKKAGFWLNDPLFDGRVKKEPDSANGYSMRQEYEKSWYLLN